MQRLLAGLLVLSLPIPSQAETCLVQEIDIPGVPSGLVRKDLAIDPVTNVIWFTLLEQNQIGKFDPEEDTFTLLDIPTPASGPHSIAVGPDGDAWFSETTANQVGRYSPTSEAFTEYPLPLPNSLPYGIVVDQSDNIVWWAEMNTKQVGRLDPRSGEIREFPLPDPQDSPTNIALRTNRRGSVREVWITQLGANKVTRLRPRPRRNPTRAQVKDFPLSDAFAFPHSVVVDQKGVVWFTESGGNRIGRVNSRQPPGERVTEFPVPTPGSVPHGITLDAQGRVWFVELTGNKIGILDPNDGSIEELEVPTPSSGPYFIRPDAQGNMWFTEGDAPKIGKVTCSP